MSHFSLCYRKADGLVRSIDYYMDPDLVDYSLSVKSELYVTSEYLDAKTSTGSQSLSALSEMFSPLVLFFVECLLLFVFSFAVLNLILFIHDDTKFKCSSLAKSIEIFFKFDKSLFKRPDSIGLFMITYILLEFFVQNIIQNSINASWVVVDTSQMITSVSFL